MAAIKVLPKAFAILEYAYWRHTPVLPQEVARELSLPPATAVRMLRDLAELGYLEQCGARKGYRRGPMAFALAGTAEEDEFVRFAAYQIEALARRMGMAIVLSRRHRNWRCILCHRNFNPAFVVDADRLRLPGLYRNTSGRLLLAYAPPTELDAILVADGLPSKEDWPEAGGRRDLLERQLAAIREAGFVERNPSCNGQSHAYALPLFRDGAPFGALAAYWSLHLDEAQSEVHRQAARQLVRALAEPRVTIPG